MSDLYLLLHLQITHLCSYNYTPGRLKECPHSVLLSLHVRLITMREYFTVMVMGRGDRIIDGVQGRQEPWYRDRIENDCLRNVLTTSFCILVFVLSETSFRLVAIVMTRAWLMGHFLKGVNRKQFEHRNL